MNASQPNKENFNILILGEKGSGKTELVNLLLNVAKLKVNNDLGVLRFLKSFSPISQQPS